MPRCVHQVECEVHRTAANPRRPSLTFWFEGSRLAVQVSRNHRSLKKAARDKFNLRTGHLQGEVAAYWYDTYSKYRFPTSISSMLSTFFPGMLSERGCCCLGSKRGRTSPSCCVAQLSHKRSISWRTLAFEFSLHATLSKNTSD